MTATAWPVTNSQYEKKEKMSMCIQTPGNFALSTDYATFLSFQLPATKSGL